MAKGDGKSRERGNDKKPQAADALLDPGLLYQTLFSQSSDGILIIDTNGNFIDFNDAAYRQLGYSREEFGKLHISDIDPDESPEEVKNRLQKIAAAGGAEFEVKHRTKAGEIRDVHVIIQALTISGRTVLHSIWRDVTERKRYESNLKEAAQTAEEERSKSEAIVKAIGDGLVILDDTFKVIYQNEIVQKMIGNLVGEVCYMAGEGRDAICENCPVELSFKDGLIHRVERARPAGDKTIHFDITSSPLRDASGKVIAVIEMVRDISERKQAEEALSKSHEQLEILVKERTAELTMMNEQLRSLSVYLQNAREEERMMVARDIHDELGQALTAIKLELAFLRKRLPEDQQPIREKAGYIAQLVESTMESVKRIAAELRPGILDHIGLTSAIEWQATEFAKRNGIPCTVVFEPEEIHIDRDRSTAVFRIFQEILTNVTRHAHASKVEALLKLEAGEVLLHVHDDGAGITEHHASDSKSLGLIGMRERAHYWGGSFAIRGEPRKGTTVAVRIPAGKTGVR